MSLKAQPGKGHGKYSLAFLWQRLLPKEWEMARRRRSQSFARLWIEALEDRTLMSASIFGNVFNDLNSDGLRSVVDPATPSQVTYLDLNNNHQFDSIVVPFSVDSGSPAISLPINPVAGELGTFGFFASPLQAQNLTQPVQNIAVSMDLTNNSDHAIQVALLSPLDINVPQVPVLFTILPGETFTGTFDGNSTNPITQAARPLANGTYAPQMPFSNPQLFLYNGDPNGEWGLAFAPPDPADLSLVVLRSWSISFTQAEPSTTTDAAGNYSFTDLSAGTYQVGLVHSSADVVTSAAGEVRAVTVTNGPATGIDFGVHATPDLTGVSFTLASPATSWGQAVTINYTLTNQGAGDAPAFDVGVYLSQNGNILPSQPLLLTTLHLDGLAAGASRSGSVTVTLPAVNPFSTLDSPANAYVGFVIDPASTLAQSKPNQSNQGSGIDLARLGGQTNVAVTTGSGVQQAPSIAVDPTNSNHVAAAYMDYSLLTTGYAGIGIAVSNDGGATWGHSSIPLPTGYDQGAASPTALFDSQGNLFVSFMAATYLGAKPSLTSPDANERAFGFQSDNGIFVAESSKASGNGGLTWTAPVAVTSHLYTGANVPVEVYPNMAVDTFATLPNGQPNPNYGSLYVTWTRYYPAGQFPGDPTSTNGSDVMIAVSSDGGSTWTTKMQTIPPPALGNKDYALTATVAGNYQVNVSTSGGYSGRLKVRVLNADKTPPALAGNQFLHSGETEPFNFRTLAAGETVYVRISSNELDSGDEADYTMQLVNLDLAQTVGSASDSRVLIGPGTGLVSALKDPNAGAIDKGAAGTGTVGLSTVTVGPGGVYVSTYTGGYFTVFSSTDGGATFTPPDFLTYLGNPFNYVSTQVKNDATLTADQFRTLPTHLIAADPSRPGVLYAVAANSADQLAAGAVAASGIVFAVSSDYGQSWTTNFSVGSNPAPLSVPVDQIVHGFYPVLNDDNAGQYAPFAASPQSQVIASQAMPSISVDGQGRITVIWYDTRADVAGQKLGVWGTVSSDGGQHFSPNFQVTNGAFDPNAGVFTDANGNNSFYLGDQIGVVAANNTAYAIWTDTRNGAQHIVFGSYSLTPASAPPVDRFSPNSTRETATDLGKVTVQQDIPSLALPPGTSNEWFRFEAGANHLSLAVSAASGGKGLRLEVTDVNGIAIPGADVANVLDSNGAIIGQAVATSSVSGTTYFVHVSSQSDAVIHYSLTLGSLTADLGTQVEGTVTDTVVLGGQNVYRLAAAVTGSLEVTFGAPGAVNSGLNVQVLGADGRGVLAASLAPVTTNDPYAHFRVPVTRGQIMLLQVSAVDADSAGDFVMHFTNLDQFEASTSSGTQAEGAISDSRQLPVPVLGNQDYALTAVTGGTMQVIVNTSGGYSGTLKVRVLNAAKTPPALAGNQFLPSGVSATFNLSSIAVGETVYVRVSGSGFNSGDHANYTLQLIDVAKAHIDDATNDSRLVPTPALGNKDYAVTAAVGGTLQVTVNASGGFAGALKVRILNAEKTALLAGSQFVESGQSAQFNISVAPGQTVFVRVSGIELNPGDQADYTLQLNNLDDAASLGISTLFFATVGDPNSIAAADLKADGTTDLLVSNANAGDSLGVLRGIGDGTFSSESQFAVGPGLDPTLGAGDRQISVANLNNDAIPDVIVPNFRAADISVLLGRGDSTFQPERRFDAVTNDNSVVTGKFTSSGNTDAIVLENFAGGASVSFAFLKGHGDGTFSPPVLYPTVFTNGAGPIVVGDFTGTHQLDLVVFSKNAAKGQIFYGNGDGTFRDGVVFDTGEPVANAVAADLNGDGKADLVTTGTNSGNVYVMIRQANATFRTPQIYHAMPPRAGDNVSVPGLVVVDFNSGHLDIIVSAQSRSGQGAAEVILLPGDGTGVFGAPQVLARTVSAGALVAGKFRNNTMDLALTDKGGVTVIYGSPVAVAPNTTSATARPLGNAVHLATQAQAIVTGHEDAYFTYTVPKEAATGAGDEIVDISALFENTTPGGLTLDVRNETNPTNVLQTSVDHAKGTRYRILAHQGDTLTIHVASNGGFGVYTLDVDVLPQIVSVEAQSPIPGGALTSLVVTLQGDLLDAQKAIDPSNYAVYRVAADGVTPIGAPIPFSAVQPVIYAPGANVDKVTHGRTFPTAARQTITLLFDQPLVAGASYLVQLLPSMQTAALTSQESLLRVNDQTFAGHPVVSLVDGELSLGSSYVVTAAVQGGSLDQLFAGTSFLTQMHNNLGAQLDSLLSKLGDSPTISATLTSQILASFLPGWLADSSRISFLIIWLDPVSIQLTDPRPATASAPNTTAFNLQTNEVTNTSSRSFLEVGGSVEIMVVAAVSGTYSLNVSDVQASARGGAILLDAGHITTVAITEAMRGGQALFQFAFQQVPSDVPASSSPAGSFTGSVVAVFTDAAAQFAGNLLSQPAITETVVTILFQVHANLDAVDPPATTTTAISNNNTTLSSEIATVIRMAETFIQEVSPENLLERIRNLPFPGFGLMRGLLNRNNPPMLNPPCDGPADEILAEPAPEDVLQLDVHAGNDAVCDAVETVRPVRAAESTNSLYGLFATAIIAVGGMFCIGNERDDGRKVRDRNRNPKIP